MSEFTEGIIFRRTDMEQVETAAKSLSMPYHIEVFNSVWAGLLPKDFHPSNPPLSTWLRALSKVIPLMAFHYGGDHGWGYIFYQNGKVLAKCEISYEIDFYLILDRLEQLYPNSDPINIYVSDSEITQRISTEVHQSPEYRAAVEAQFQNKNVKAFAYFDVTQETIDRLDKLLTPEMYLENFLEQPNQFRALLNLRELEWKSYHYSELKRDERD